MSFQVSLPPGTLRTWVQNLNLNIFVVVLLLHQWGVLLVEDDDKWFQSHWGLIAGEGMYELVRRLTLNLYSSSRQTSSLRSYWTAGCHGDPPVHWPTARRPEHLPRWPHHSHYQDRHPERLVGGTTGWREGRYLSRQLCHFLTFHLKYLKNNRMRIEVY